MSNHPHEKPTPIPRLFRTVTKEANEGGYETALFQVFHEDLQVVGEWLHPERGLPEYVRQQISAIKNAKDATRANPANKY